MRKRLPRCSRNAKLPSRNRKRLCEKGGILYTKLMRTPCYPTDLTDEQWAVVEPLLPAAKPGGRPRRTDLRAV